MIMDQKIDFDYQSLLEECTTQNDVLTKHSNTRKKAEEEYQALAKEFDEAVQETEQIRDENRRLKIELTRELNVQTFQHGHFSYWSTLMTNLTNVKSDNTAANRLIESNINSLITGYENLDSALDQKAITEQSKKTKKDNEILVSEIERHRQKFDKLKASLDKKRYVSIDPLLIESIRARTREFFGNIDFMKQKLATINKNEEALNKNIRNIKNQLQYTS